MKKLKLILPIAAAISGFMMSGCMQEAGTTDVPEIKITRLGSDDSTSVKVRFELSENTEWYAYAIGSDSDHDAFIEGSMSGIERGEGNEPAEILFTDLEPTSVYTVYAQAYSKSGEKSGLAMMSVATPDLAINIELQYVTSSSCGFKVEFDSEYYECKYYLGTEADKDAFMAGEMEDGRLTEVDGYGCVNYYEGVASGNHVFYAIGYDRYGMESKLFEIPVTIPSEGSNEVPDVEFVLESIDIYKGSYKFVPNEACGKITCSIGDVGYVSNMISSAGWKNDAVAMLDSWSTASGVSSYTVESGDLEFDYYTDLMTDLSLELYVLAYDKSGNPAGVRKYAVKTPAVDENLPEAGIESIKVENITSAGATYTIVPDENTFAIYYDTYDAEYYDMISGSSDYGEFFIHNEIVSGGGKFSYGNGQVIYAELEGLPYTEYLLCVAPMNGNGPVDAGWGELAVSEKYRTLSE